MTNQEAIEVLQETIMYFGRKNGKTKYVNALKLSIPALRKEQRRLELIEYYLNEVKKSRVSGFHKHEETCVHRLIVLQRCEVKDE